LTDWIRRKSRSQNIPIVIVGETQGGKSTLALALAKNIDSNFTLDRVAFTATHFIRLVNDPERKRGDVIVLEEAGVNVSRSEWWSFVNRAILYVAQTYGWKGLIVILTLPAMRYLDSRVAMLLKAYIETMKLMKQEKKIRFKFQTIETRKKIGVRGREIYYYRPVTYVAGIRAVVDYFEAEYPPEELLKAYFKKANEWKDALATNLERESIKVDTIAEPFDYQKAIDDVLIKRTFKEFLDEKNRWNISKVCAVYGIGQQKAKVFINLVEERMKEMGMVKPEIVRRVPIRVFTQTPVYATQKKDISGAKWASTEQNEEKEAKVEAKDNKNA
jgi:hypothetical protein